MTANETGARLVGRATPNWSAKSAVLPAFAARRGASTTAASGWTRDAVLTSSLEEATGQVSRPSPALPMTADETGVPSAHHVTPNSSAKSVDLPVFAARRGASTTAASGWTKDAAPTSPSAQATALLRDHHPRKSSPAPQTMANETGVTPVVVATSNSTARSAARPAFKTRPGASTNAASGSTMAAAPSSASADAT